METLQSGSGLREVDDKELLDLPGDVVDVVVTSAALDGRTLEEIGREDAARGVFLRRITRGGQPLGILPGLQVFRGDVLTIVGPAANVARAIELIGVADRATDVTDMLVVATAIVAGALIGLPALHVGNLEIGLEPAGGRAARRVGLPAGCARSSRGGSAAFPGPRSGSSNRSGSRDLSRSSGSTRVPISCEACRRAARVSSWPER